MSATVAQTCHVPDCPYVTLPDEDRKVVTERGWYPSKELEAAFAQHIPHLRELADALPVGACPWWCALPKNHPCSPHDFTRTHAVDFGGLVQVIQTEYDDGTAEDVYLIGPKEEDYLSPAQARQLAAALLNAADKLDEITEATR